MSSSISSAFPQPPEEGLFRLIYCSVSAKPIDDALANAILDQARRNNARHNITGLLLADEKLFVQYLEGEAQDVKAIFKKISQDPRHRCVVELLRQSAVGERLYPDWSMAWGRASRDEIRAIVHDAKNRLEQGAFTPWAPAVGLFTLLIDSEFGQEYSQVVASAAHRPMQEASA
jgi:Sensors of blue-light using FAD